MISIVQDIPQSRQAMIQFPCQSLQSLSSLKYMLTTFGHQWIGELQNKFHHSLLLIQTNCLKTRNCTRWRTDWHTRTLWWWDRISESHQRQLVPQGGNTGRRGSAARRGIVAPWIVSEDGASARRGSTARRGRRRRIPPRRPPRRGSAARRGRRRARGRRRGGGGIGAPWIPPRWEDGASAQEAGSLRDGLRDDVDRRRGSVPVVDGEEGRDRCPWSTAGGGWDGMVKRYTTSLQK